MTGQKPPNFTRVPNEILDEMRDMEESELRVVLAIARKTVGWQEPEAEITVTEFEEMTGLSRPAIVAGLRAGIERGVISRSKVKRSYNYRLSVNSVYRSDPSTGKVTLPMSVNSVNRAEHLSVNSVDHDRLTEFTPPTPPLKEEIKLKENGGVKAALIRLGLDASQADSAVAAGTVSSSADVERCAAFLDELKERKPPLQRPIGLLWGSYLKQGHLPPVPQQQSNGDNRPRFPDGSIDYATYDRLIAERRI